METCLHSRGAALNAHETGIFTIMGSNVNNAQSRLLQAQAGLESAKNDKKRAIANGNYARCKSETPTFVDGKKLNKYDYNIYRYQRLVKQYKEQLAKAKKAAKK